MNRVYLDNAATTKVRQEVIDAMTVAWQDAYGNASSIYEEGEYAKELLTKARESVAKSINADPKEIFFTSCGTESDNWALKGAASYISRINPNKKKIITSAIEHHAILHSCDSLAKMGYEIVKLPVDSNGLVNPNDLEANIDDSTIIVSIMMANNEIGTIQPIKELAEICKKNKVLFHTDAVQAVGSIPVDVKELGIDMLSMSGHKLHAPKGIGALYIRKGVRIDNFMDGGAQEMKKRAGTENLPYILGLAKALELATSEMEANMARLIDIRDTLINEIETKIPYCRLNGDRKNRLPGNVNFSFEFIEGESLLLLLNSMGFACSSGSACTSGSLDPSHVLLAIGLPHEIAHGSLRVSIGKFNTKEEVLSIVDPLSKIVQRLRDMSPLYEDFMAGRSFVQGTCEKCCKDSCGVSGTCSKQK